jgi:hypothetical protein
MLEPGRPRGVTADGIAETAAIRSVDSPMLLLDWRRRIDMRAYVSPVIGALLLAGCATGSPSSRVATDRSGSEPSSAPARCSAADPDRWAWFCAIGQSLYGIGANLQPDTQLRSK